MINSPISPSRLFVLFMAIVAFVNSAILPALSNTRVYGPPATIPSTLEFDNNASETARARVGSAYAQLGMRFEKNQGQFDAQVKFAARGAGYALWLTGDEAVMTLSGNHGGASTAEMARAVIDQKKSPDQTSEEKAAVIRMKLVNSNRTASMSGENELPGRTNYFVSNDPANWHTGVSGYSRVVYKSVYRGVDLVYYGNGRELEYDFKVAAGANPAAIGIRFDGARRLRVDPMQDDTNGNLLRFSSTTGDYLFTNCRKGMVYAGRGSVTTNFCKITLTASMPGQTLTALANTCTRAASAQLVAQGKTLTITDKDMGNDSCACQ